MTVKQRIAKRRAINKRLGEQDAAHRCAHCKTVLDRTRVAMGWRFCSTECEEAYVAFHERWTAAKARVR